VVYLELTEIHLKFEENHNRTFRIAGLFAEVRIRDLTNEEEY
jgi:hypothetical protein